MIKILALLSFGLFFVINIYTINGGHNWGDDFAQYIQHSINLLEHKPYTSNIALDPWIFYPPGFPIILSSAILWFGFNIKLFKCINVLLWAISALTVYDLVLKRLNIFWARMITVWFLSSPFFFFFKQNVLSDIPFMCFVLLSLWAFMKYEEYQEQGLVHLSRTFLFVSILCMSYSLLIRWAGASLILSVIVYFCVVKREWRKSLGFVLGAALSWLIAAQCGSSAIGYFDKTTASFQEWLWASWNSIAYVYQVIGGFFVSDRIPFPRIIRPGADSFFKFVAGASLCFIMGLFIYRLYRRKISFLGCFTFFYLIGVILWPIPGGTRYVLPIIIPITIYFIKWIEPVFRNMATFIFLVLMLSNIFVIAENFKFNDDDIFQKSSLEMIRWVELNIKPGEFYMFFKPRALGLLTHRIGATFWVNPQDENRWYKRIKPLHISYLIANKSMDQFSRYNNLNLKVDNDEIYMNRIWENEQYKIFIVRVR